MSLPSLRSNVYYRRDIALQMMMAAPQPIFVYYQPNHATDADNEVDAVDDNDVVVVVAVVVVDVT